MNTKILKISAIILSLTPLTLMAAKHRAAAAGVKGMTTIAEVKATNKAYQENEGSNVNDKINDHMAKATESKAVIEENYEAQ